jgi:hypothetical protein
MMKRWGWSAVALAMLLASCGGGGGGVQSGGSTSPGSGSGGSGGGGTGSTPPATNTTITNLVASQTFANDASTTLATLDTSAVTTTRASAAASTLTISYDAATKSYTVSEPGRSQTFAPADANPSGDTTFKKSNGSGNDYLTLVTTPFETSTANRYVGLGFWQRNQVSGTTQDTSFDLFTYGLDTPTGAVPRTGSATYAMDAFAFLNILGKAPVTLQGTGTFDVDFQTGTFAQNAFLSTFNVVTGRQVATGYLPLKTSGRLSSGDGSFTGDMSFQDPSDLRTAITGTAAGRFYGPGAEEVGVTFAGSNADGATLNGGYTGQRGTGPATQNLSVTNIVASQSFNVDVEGTSTSTAAIKLAPDGSVQYQPGSSLYEVANLTPADIVGGAANFTTYRQTVNGHLVTVALYKPAAGSGALTLTYASFGTWQQQGSTQFPNAVTDQVFAFGIATDPSLIAGRTGSASYSGIAYGSGQDAASGVHYDTSGTATVDINFSTQSFQTVLALKGVGSDGQARDFGTFSGGAALGFNKELSAGLVQNGNYAGSTVGRLYGPDGEEVAGSYYALVGQQLALRGIYAGKRQ